MSTSPDLDFTIEPERYELADLAASLELDRRDFLRVLGGGLVVLWLTRDAEAQPPGGGGRRGGGGAAPREIGAWVHIDESGKIQVFTGKAEVGQNIRTSLSQVVAEELRVPVEAVTMVMADTALTPFDMGTFGSRTTPSMAPQLRMAAAAAREALRDLAADEWKVEKAALTVSDGKVRHADRSAAFGELTHGRKLAKVIGDGVAGTPPAEWKTAGRTVAKVNGRAFVTGAHRYASDVSRPGMAHGKVLRPPTWGATLASLDASAAEAMPGVKVVREGDFVGVVAPDDHAAGRALAALKAEWTPAEGPQPSDAELYADLVKHAEAFPARKAALAQALESADVKVEAEYHVAYIAHAPLEPRAAAAEWEGDKLTVWVGTQRPFGVRGDLARELKIGEDKVRVIVPDTGSGYGGKHTNEAAVEAARLSRAVGKPVKRVWTREEEFTWGYARPAGVIAVAAGARKNGKLAAWSFHNINSGGSALECPYDVPEKDVAFRPSRSPLKQGSYRALAATANTFARESAIDELARGVKMDPLAFRMANLSDDRLRDVLKAAAERFGWGKAESRDGRGVGIACGIDKGGRIATCAEVAVDRESGAVKVVRLVAAFDCGAILNPDHLTNQVEGSLVMGLGGALFEALKFEGGKLTNPRFSRYRVPRFSDAPTIEVVLLDRKDQPSAGAGEAPIIAVAPAIGNAICAATGVRLRSMPMAPQGKIPLGEAAAAGG